MLFYNIVKSRSFFRIFEFSVAKLSNRNICNFVTMLYVYDRTVNCESVKLHRYKEVYDLFNGSMLKSKFLQIYTIQVANPIKIKLLKK